MAYLGNSLTVQQYAPTISYLSGNGSTTVFTLPIAVASAAQIIVHVENVPQNPAFAFSVSGTTLTFTSAPPSGTNNIWVEYTALQTNTIAPSQGTVQDSSFGSITKIPFVSGASIGAGNASIMKNRIINGACVIDQRNAGASVTPTADGTYTLDRFAVRISQASKISVQQNAGAVTPPVGFTKYLGVTSLAATTVGASDYFSIQTVIEGLNVGDLGWGTANAKTVTLSAWVYSSLTGTFGGSIANYSANRSYPFTYSISSANTWTQISVTIAGDTTGTWETTNAGGPRIYFGLGVGSTFSATAGSWNSGSFIQSATGATSVVGTNGATFYITGVQLEVGSSATGFEYRQYGQELALCQRYYEKSYNQDAVPASITSNGAFIFQATNLSSGTPTLTNTMPFAVVKRAAVTPTFYSPVTGTSGKARDYSTSADVNANANTTGTQSFSWYATMGATQTQINLGVQWTVSAEL